MAQRYKLTIEYDGRPYQGWQRQHHGPSVQEAIETAVTSFCGEEVTVVGSGRTDAGVHALGQVAHLDIEKPTEPFQLTEALNFHLKHEAISILSAEPVDEAFHARFSAQKRFYRYEILNRRARPTFDEGKVWHVPQPMDADIMHNAARALVGTHDFTSFRSQHCQSKSPIKTLDAIAVTREGDRISVTLEARSFLYNQVRITLGTLAKIGKGYWPADIIPEILEARDRSKAGHTAPANGLYFVQVDY